MCIVIIIAGKHLYSEIRDIKVKKSNISVYTLSTPNGIHDAGCY